MQKKLISLCFGILFIKASFAAVDLAASQTEVAITNNTSQTVTLQTTLTTTDKEFKQGEDWDRKDLSLAPYETKKVLWFKRNVPEKQIYQFDLAITNPRYSNEKLIFTFIQQGKKTFGSDITASLTFPDQYKLDILSQYGLEKYPSDFWNTIYTVYARSYLPHGKLFSSYHFVIDNQVEKNYFDVIDPKKISVLTYNTELMPFYANTVDDLNQPSIRAQDIPEKIKNYDVVMIEELFDRNLRNTFIEKISGDYPFHTEVVGSGTERPLTGGVMIFSKWPIIKEDQMIYKACRELDCLAAKGIVHAAISKRGKIYHLLGTHLQSGELDDDAKMRQQQLQEMADFITSLNIDFFEPVLMGGDFNINQFDKESAALYTLLQVNLLKNNGYVYSIDNTINTMSVDKHPTRLDYIFYSNLHTIPKTAFNEVFILRDLGNEKMWPKFDLSDHFPVASYFEF